MAQVCVYEAQLKETSALIAESLGIEKWQLVFQSRSGPAAQPWLGPDVRDYLRELRGLGTREIVLAPIGFVSDHMEIIYDLDTEARRLCDELGLNMIRAETVGTHPAFIRMIRELILERLEPDREKRFLGALGPAKDTCAAGCCAAVKLTCGCAASEDKDETIANHWWRHHRSVGDTPNPGTSHDAGEQIEVTLLGNRAVGLAGSFKLGSATDFFSKVVPILSLPRNRK